MCCHLESHFEYTDLQACPSSIKGCLGPASQHPKLHLDQFNHFCRAHGCEKSQHTDFNEDTTNQSASVACSNIWL